MFYYRALIPLALLISYSSYASSPEYSVDDEPAITELSELESAFEGDKLAEDNQDKPFLNGSQLNYNFRSYFLNRRREGSDNSEAFAMGGEISYQSGQWLDRFSIGASYYFSQKVYAPDERGGTGLLQPGQQSYSTLGQAYIDYRFYNSHHIKLNRFTFNLPFINASDTRMVPNTFQGIGIYSISDLPFDYAIGYLDKIKTKISTDFSPLYNVAGISGDDHGVTLAAIRTSSIINSDLTVMLYNAPEYHRASYSEFSYSFDDNANTQRAKILLQYMQQQSIGNEVAGEFNTQAYGIMFTYQLPNTIVSLVYTDVDDDNQMLSPWGSYPGFNSMIVQDFERAGEQAWRIGFSTDLSSWIIPGLKLTTNYVKGNTPDSGNSQSPDQSELDITLDYTLQNGPLEGLWIRLRKARIQQDDSLGGTDFNDYRMIINYPIQIF